MERLKDYINESIGSKELRNGMRMNEISMSQMENILVSDDFIGIGSDPFAEIFKDRIVRDKKKDFRSLYGNVKGYTKYYDISYNGQTIGVISIFYLRDIKNLSSTQKRLFSELFYVIDKGDEMSNIQESKPVSGKTYSGRLMITDTDMVSVMKQLDKSVYIPFLQISPIAKERADISQIAVIKLLFEMLVDMLSKQGITRICAFGADYRLAEKYVRLGGFKSLGNIMDTLKKTMYKNYTGDVDVWDFVEKCYSFVYKDIK